MDWTPAQRELMAIIYGGHGFWDPPCDHPGPVWVVDPDGTGRCTMCPARWTMADEDERTARIAAGPPEGESEHDRRWREFREAAHASRPMILPLPQVVVDPKMPPGTVGLRSPRPGIVVQEMLTFWRARLNEDERVAQLAAEANPAPRPRYPTGNGGLRGAISIGMHHIRQNPARTLARVAASRRVLELCATETAETGGRPLALRVIRAEIAAWSDHPQYRAEWAP